MKHLSKPGQYLVGADEQDVLPKRSVDRLAPIRKLTLLKEYLT